MLVPGAGNGSRSALCCSLSCRARGASSSSSFPSGGAGCSPSSCEAPLWQLWSGWGRGRPQGFLNRIIFSRINIAQLLGLGWFIGGLRACKARSCPRGHSDSATAGSLNLGPFGPNILLWVCFLRNSLAKEAWWLHGWSSSGSASSSLPCSAGASRGPPSPGSCQGSLFPPQALSAPSAAR